MTEPVRVQFDGGEVLAVQIEGKPFVVLKPAVEALGLSYPAQYRKLEDRSWATVAQRAMVAEDGRTRQMIVVDVRTFLMLLATVNENNVADDKRGLLVTYQSDVADLIEQHFAKPSPRPLDLSTPEGVLELAEQNMRNARELVAAKKRVLELAGPAAHAETFRAAEGLRTVGDVANDFITHCKTAHPGVVVLHRLVWDHAAVVGLVIRGNTVRHNQPTSQAIRAGWAVPHRAQYDTHTRGTQTTVTTRLTPRGEARLWDAMVHHIESYGTLELQESA